MAEKTLVDKVGQTVGIGMAMASDVAGAIKTAIDAAATTVTQVLDTASGKKAATKTVTKKAAKKSPAKKVAKKAAAKKTPVKRAAKKTVNTSASLKRKKRPRGAGANT
jgi:ribosomal protein S5